MKIKILPLLLAVITALTLVVPVVRPAQAAYENTYTNTGDQRADIIGVALTQVGYREGSNNDTKYGDWYGLPNHPWCAMFVSWCVNQAGISTNILKKAALARPSAFGYSTYYSSSEYTPQSGDLFFKKGFSHVGLVYYVDGAYFYTVEGNTNASGGSEGIEVQIRRRKLSDYYFVCPNYASDVGHNYEKHYDDAHPHRVFYKCSDSGCSKSYYVDDYLTLDSCKECKQANCSHTYGEWKEAGENDHKRVCTNCEKEETKSHNWVDGETLREATCKAAGSKKQSCKDCGFERIKIVEKTDDHKFSEWEFSTDSEHKRVCENCDTKETEEHAIDEETKWSTDEEQHWYDCEVCEEKIKLDNHVFGDDCVSPCETCGFVREDGHVYVDEYSINETSHWFECKRCDETGNMEEHVYTAACDETCDTCGYVREVTHAYSTDLTSDGTGHWYECETCGKQDGFDGHTPGPEATEFAAQNCELCGFELVPILEHVHKFDMSSDAVSHWGTCVCGEVMEVQNHSWDVSTGACSACQISSAAQLEQKNWDFVWFGAIGLMLIVAITPMAVVIGKRRHDAQYAGDPYS